MQFLLSHWHCILPVIGIGAAFFFLREKPKEKKNDHGSTGNQQDINKE